jgi:ribosomal protein L37AE/L43A
MAWVLVTKVDRHYCPNCGNQWERRAPSWFQITCPACLIDFKKNSGWVTLSEVVVALLQDEPDRNVY